MLGHFFQIIHDTMASTMAMSFRKHSFAAVNQSKYPSRFQREITQLVLLFEVSIQKLNQCLEYIGSLIFYLDSKSSQGPDQ